MWRCPHLSGLVFTPGSSSSQSEVLERVALPVLEPVAEDPDGDVRCRAMQLLVHLLGESPRWAEPLLAIISSVSFLMVYYNGTG